MEYVTGDGSVHPCTHCQRIQTMYLIAHATLEHYGYCTNCGTVVSQEKWRIWFTVLRIEDERRLNSR